MSNTHLLQVRRKIAKASAPVGGGKNPDIVLATIDAAAGTLDPAFDAHVGPIQHWALAMWQQWQTATSMHEIMENARHAVCGPAGVRWAKVSGPASATLA
eukprot:1045034-Karenia_brevis.AAC.1